MRDQAIRCPYCGAEDEDTGEVRAYAELNGHTDVLSYCDECEREYVVEVYLNVHARPLGNGEREQFDAEMEVAP